MIHPNTWKIILVLQTAQLQATIQMKLIINVINVIQTVYPAVVHYQIIVFPVVIQQNFYL